MNYATRITLAVVLQMALLLVICGQAAAFNPQRLWRIEGFVDLFVEDITQTGTEVPFGISPFIASDGVVDFSAGIIATFEAPDNDRDGKPDNGLYPVDMEYFRVQIGDTSWDETMPSTGMQFQIEGGLVTGIKGTYTPTMPAHPDLSFMLPASPGAWEALDERGSDNVGSLIGSYALRDGIIPEPATMALLSIGGLMMLRRRRRR